MKRLLLASAAVAGLMLASPAFAAHDHSGPPENPDGATQGGGQGHFRDNGGSSNGGSSNGGDDSGGDSSGSGSGDSADDGDDDSGNGNAGSDDGANRRHGTINGDTVVNGGDQGLVAAEILRAVPLASKLANFDFNKDGVINGGDQAFQASMVLPGKCVLVTPWP